MPDIGNIPTVQSGDLGQHSHWNYMILKVEDTTVGHRHDGVGSYGPLTSFSGGTFTNLSANALFVGSTTVLGGPVNVSGQLVVASSLTAGQYSSGGILGVGGNASFGGKVTVTSGLFPGLYLAPGNLSDSQIVTGLVAGSNIGITPSQGAGAGVVFISVTGAPLAGTNTSFGTLVLGSTTALNTFQVSAQTNLAGLVVGNVSSSGSVTLQSRLIANDAVFSNVSVGTANFAGTVSVQSALTTLAGFIGTNISTNTLNVSGISSLQTVNLSALVVDTGRFTTNISTYTLNVSGLGSFGLLNALSNLSVAGNVQVQSRTLTNDAIITGNLSAGSLVTGSAIFTNISTASLVTQSALITTLSAGAVYAGSGIFGQVTLGSAQVTQLSAGSVYAGSGTFGNLVVGSMAATNLSTTTLIVGSAQIGYETNLSGTVYSQVNTSAGNLRVFMLSSGRAYFSLNVQNASAVPDTAGLAGLITYYDNSATQFVWQITPSSGTTNTIVTMRSAGLEVPLNFSAGSMMVGSAQFTAFSAGAAVISSAIVTNNLSAGWLTVGSAAGGGGIVTKLSAGTGAFFGNVNFSAGQNVFVSADTSTNTITFNASTAPGIGISPGANTSFGTLAIGSTTLITGAQFQFSGDAIFNNISAPTPIGGITQFSGLVSYSTNTQWLTATLGVTTVNISSNTATHGGIVGGSATFTNISTGTILMGSGQVSNTFTVSGAFRGGGTIWKIGQVTVTTGGTTTISLTGLNVSNNNGIQSFLVLYNLVNNSLAADGFSIGANGDTSNWRANVHGTNKSGQLASVFVNRASIGSDPTNGGIWLFSGTTVVGEAHIYLSPTAGIHGHARTTTWNVSGATTSGPIGTETDFINTLGGTVTNISGIQINAELASGIGTSSFMAVYAVNA